MSSVPPVPPLITQRPVVPPPPTQPPAFRPPQSPPAGGIPPKPSGIPPKPPEKPGVTLAHPRDITKSPFRFLPLLLGAIALLFFGWFVVSKFLNRSPKTPSSTQSTTGKNTSQAKPAGPQKTITYWGLWEPSTVMTSVLKDFEAQNPGVSVNYVQQSAKDYRERVQDALKKGQGPDVFRYHATWVPMFKTQLATLPSTIMSAQEFSSTFYPVAAAQLKTADGIVGIPLMYDGLGLYYNKKIFTAAGKTPPTSWTDLETIAKALTVRNAAKQIDRAGIALGTTSNVDNFSDIIGLLLLQNGADPANPSTQLVSDAIKYYTNFSKVHKVWDDTLPNSTYAFATEKTAMMIAQSWRAFEVKSINPNIDFAIAPVPQLPGTSVTWASYWAEGVSKTSKEQELSWKLLKYLSSKEVMVKLHSSAATTMPRLFGEIYARTDLKDSIATDPYMSAFVQDAPKAQSWYLASKTFDNGLNDQIVKYYEDAINAVNTGKSTLQEALATADKGVKQVLQQFGVK